ncbi:hypothetical protein GP486_002014 [Trichoglossum hirsutum]|uniref:RhoGAP-domain-containing protein n=1 Tax=Trichoglossum hirsutum TaxID=265104 RepID=A0A9P8RSI3_9PEZI|nr:hypothetical protein GP486_002014 [Trichoglossum hirsutum]
MNEDQQLSGQRAPSSELPATGNTNAPANGATIPTGDSPASAVAPPHTGEAPRMVEEVLQSDIGVSTLLNRLKQSIASARDFAAFLGKRSALEDGHATGLRKLCKTTHEAIRRPDNRQGSYAQQLEEVMRIHERMVENGLAFSLSLHQMHDDLLELAMSMERGRKHWKQAGMNAEKRVQDSESLMEKAKAKYDALAEEYDRARTGDRQPGKLFGLKGPKSAQQYEDDVLRKLQAADAEYSSRVKSANAQRQELLSTLRPQALKALQDLVAECDSGLTLQLQKFASYNEKLLLNNGLTSLAPQQQTPPSARRQSQPPLSYPPPSFPMSAPQQYIPAGAQGHIPPTSSMAQPPLGNDFGLLGPPGPQGPSGPPGPPGPPMPAMQRQYPQVNIPGPPQLSTPSPFSPMSLDQPQIHATPPAHVAAPSPYLPDPTPLRPAFGVPLQTLFERDGSAVPMIVYQCIQAVDLYGLEIEGIYRVSGTNSHVQKIRAMFEKDSSKVDFRNPEDFFQDVNSVTSVLKQFFRDLPDPLLTNEHYGEFIAAARADDDILRRDSLHALINDLPDANYATLRALALHLNRVQERSSINRMNSGNLAICLGPTLMGSNSGPNIADASYQVRVIETILQNTFQIFDDD